MSRTERGFTLVELGMVVAILAILVPLVLVFWRGLDARDREIRAQQAFTASVRTVSEELRRDLRFGVPSAGLAFAGDAACGAVRYVRGDDGTLVRSTATCGDRFLARDVERLEFASSGISLHFSKDVGGMVPARGTFAIGVPGVTAW